MAALAHITIESFIGAIAVDQHAASFTGNEVFFGTFRAHPYLAILAIGCFVLRHFLAAVFTSNGFHNCKISYLTENVAALQENGEENDRKHI